MYIHDSKRAREQTKQLPAKENWKIPTSNRMVGLHEDINGRAESWDEFFNRYNIPHEPPYEGIYDLEL